MILDYDHLNGCLPFKRLHCLDHLEHSVELLFLRSGADRKAVFHIRFSTAVIPVRWQRYSLLYSVAMLQAGWKKTCERQMTGDDDVACFTVKAYCFCGCTGLV